MKTESKILRLLIDENHQFTIREISQKIKSDYKITHTAVQRLLKKKILLSETIGKSTLCRLNEANYSIEVYESENERKETIFKNKNIKNLYQEVMSKLSTKFFIFLIFGSYAKGKQTSSSDIDIMLVSNEKGFEERILDILSLLPIKTHPLVFTEEEFIRMKDAKKLNVVKEAIGNNVILYGAETYYWLKNA